MTYHTVTALCLFYFYRFVGEHQLCIIYFYFCSFLSLSIYFVFKKPPWHFLLHLCICTLWLKTQQSILFTYVFEVFEWKFTSDYVVVVVVVALPFYTTFIVARIQYIWFYLYLYRQAYAYALKQFHFIFRMKMTQLETSQGGKRYTEKVTNRSSKLLRKTGKMVGYINLYIYIYCVYRHCM